MKWFFTQTVLHYIESVKNFIWQKVTHFGHETNGMHHCKSLCGIKQFSYRDVKHDRAWKLTEFY